MVGKRNTRHTLIRVSALGLAVVFVFFVAQVFFHSHVNGQSEATCQVCHAAHLGSTPTAGTTSLVSPLLAAGYVEPFVVTIHQEFFFHDSPSRAPPTA